MSTNSVKVKGGLFSALSQIQANSTAVNMRELVAEARCSSAGDPVAYARVSWVFSHVDSVITSLLAIVKTPNRNGITTKVVRMGPDGRITAEFMDRNSNPEVIFESPGGVISRGVILIAEDGQGESCQSFSVKKDGKLVALHHRPALVSAHPMMGFDKFFGLQKCEDPEITARWAASDFSDAARVTEILGNKDTKNDEGVFEYVTTAIREDHERRKKEASPKDATAEIIDALAASSTNGAKIAAEIKEKTQE